MLLEVLFGERHLKKIIFCLVIIFFCNFFSFSQQTSFKDLSSEEKLFCMLSSNIIENNNQSHDTLNPDSNGKNLSAKLLESSWDVSNYFELLNVLDELFDYKNYDAYSDFSVKVSEAKSESLISSAAEYGIPFAQLSSFLFVPYLKDKLGSSGTMAWNYGRAITILRWGIGAGLIDEDEAKERAKPFIDTITKTFCSFEDYCCHYLYGASFFYCDYFESMPNFVQVRYNNFMSFIAKYGQFFSDDCFHGNKDGNSKCLTFEALRNSMHAEELSKYTEYFSISKAYRHYSDFENAEKIVAAYSDGGNIKNDFLPIDGTPYFYEAAGNILLNAKKIQDIQSIYESAEDMFAKLPKNSSLYNNIYALYTFSVFTNNDYISALKLSEQISEDYAEIREIYHIRALCYTYRFLDSEEAGDTRLADEFLNNSIQMFIKAYKKGYSLSKTEQEFILNYSGQSIEELVLPAADFWTI